MMYDMNQEKFEEFLKEYLVNLQYKEPHSSNPLYDIYELRDDVYVAGRGIVSKGYCTLGLISVEKLKERIANGLNINFKDADGNTELHKATMDNLAEKVKLLCEAGADVNIENNEGRTPIDIVSGLREFPTPCKIGRILKSHGAKEKEQ